jgi:transposase
MKLANPVKTRAIAEAKIKTDKLDSKTLAHLLRGDLIAECYVPSKEIRLQRTFLGHRVTISHEQNRIENRIYSLLDKYDLKYPYERNMFGVHGMQWLHSLKLDGHDQGVFNSLLRQLEFLNEEETSANSEIASLTFQSKYAPKIMSMTGFDYYSASMMSALIADINRFRSPSKLVSWVGMCPTVHQTGETMYYGKIKKGSKKKAQWIMTQVANVAAQHDPRMKAYYDRLVKRGLHHNIAITHIANKMLKIIWHMLTDDTLYNERKEKLYASKLKRLEKIAG